MVKPGVIIVNAARGGLIDEQALADAIRDGRVRGAGIDVFSTEPATRTTRCSGCRASSSPRTSARPPRRRRTRPARRSPDRCGSRCAATSCRTRSTSQATGAGRRRGPAVDQPGRRGCGRMLTAICGSVPAEVTVEVRGDLSAQDTSILQLAACAGIFGDVARGGRDLRQRADAGRRRTGLVLTRQRAPRRPATTARWCRCARRWPTARPARCPAPCPARSWSRSWSRSTAGTSICAPRATCWSPPTRTGPGVMGTVGTLLGNAEINIEARADLARTSPAHAAHHGAPAVRSARCRTTLRTRQRSPGLGHPGDPGLSARAACSHHPLNWSI